jgi:hypothetical protein
MIIAAKPIAPGFEADEYRWSMIRKSGYRLSEKIMPNQKPRGSIS